MRRDDIGHDPVIAAVLAATGRDLATIAWDRTSTRDDGHGVVSHESRDVAGGVATTMSLKLHEDEDAAWFATIGWDVVSYHAQRGRRSLTVRRHLPESVTDGLVGRTADAVADLPGFDRLAIVGVRTSSVGIDVIVHPSGPYTP